MAITTTQPANGTGSSITNASTYTTGSIAFTSGRLQLCAFVVAVGTGPITIVPTISNGTAAGLTWVEITSARTDFNTLATPKRRLTLFRAQTTGAITTGTYTFNATSAAGCCWAFMEFAGTINDATNNGAGVIGSVTSLAQNAALSNSITISPAPNVGPNATYGAFSHITSENITQGTGMTLLDNVLSGANTPGALGTEWALAGQNPVAASWTTSSVNGGVAIELLAPGLPDVALAPRNPGSFGIGNPYP